MNNADVYTALKKLSPKAREQFMKEAWTKARAEHQFSFDNGAYRPIMPVPHDKQAEIIASPAKRKVVVCGRRFGKTMMNALIASQALIDHRKAFIVSTSQDQADVTWGYLRKWWGEAVAKGGVYKNETKRLLETKTGAIKVKTGSDADVLRGFDADVLILDECQRLDPAAWYEVGAPMLADRDGIAVFTGTPLRKNWFYKLYNQAIGDTAGRWQAWHGTSFDNPYLSKEALNELVGDMTDDAYRQEIQAEFLEGTGQVFRNIEACATVTELPSPYNSDIVFGIDLAQTTDYTVIIGIDRKTRRMVAYDRFNRQSWAATRARIIALCEQWQPETVYVEANSVGGPNSEALADDGLPISQFMTTAQSKPPLIESLALAFERHEIGVLNNPVLLGELGAFERKVSPTTGRSQYSAPDGMHDDTVMSLAIAWHGCMSPREVEVYEELDFFA